MDNVLTLVSADNNNLEQNDIENLCQDMIERGADVGPVSCLAKNKAYDIRFQKLSLADADETARSWLGSAQVDILAQNTDHRRKRLFVADMDSTIVAGETLDDLAELAGIGTEVAKITARAMNGEIAFREALQERMALLRGLPASYLDETAEAMQLNPGAETLLNTLNANSVYTALISGGFRFFTSRVADQLGFDFHKGNHIEIINDRFSGDVVDPIVTKTVKLEMLKTLASEQKVDLSETLTVGDGANDIPMLKAAGLGVAYYAKPVVIASAPAQVNHTDLSTLLYFQGYNRDEFVTQSDNNL